MATHIFSKLPDLLSKCLRLEKLGCQIDRITLFKGLSGHTSVDDAFNNVMHSLAAISKSCLVIFFLWLDSVVTDIV